ncbi:hypothetical protein NDU88_000952 [Pleurodeles waltl]|uniref:Apolipoprotein F n=1 Tax=Pleurodeles waltl TaxID=8319 RepID=A0AAV7S9I4_PLEWA|nr:hypothetical protein NDU88_000952 [Pleurodeles waltl]
MGWTLLICLCLLGEHASGHLLLPNATGGHDGLPESGRDALDVAEVDDEPPAFNRVAPYGQADESERLAKALMDSIYGSFPTLRLSQATGGLSCQELSVVSRLGHLELSSDLVDIALVLALTGLRCHTEAELHILQLYENLGVGEVNDIFLEILKYAAADSKPLGAPIAHRSFDAPFTDNRADAGNLPALLFNVDQIAAPFRGSEPHPFTHRCVKLTKVRGFLLVGLASSHHASWEEAATMCRRLRDLCAGVATNATNDFQVLRREGSYFVPCPGASSWLHLCQSPHHSLRRRSPPEHCNDQREQEVHGVLQWMPLASTYYNLGTSMYYAALNCRELAKERAWEAVLDLGYDAVVALTGGATGIVGFGVAASVKPGVKAGVQAVMEYIKRTNLSDQ